MNEGEFKPEELTEKQLLWNKKLEEVEQRTDVPGNKMDENIIETVTALELLSIPTAISCGGHIEKFNSPYIGLQTPPAPKETFIDQQKNIDLIAGQYNFSIQDYLKLCKEKRYSGQVPPEMDKTYRQIQKDAIKISMQNSKTPEREEWEEEIKKIDDKVNKLLEEFYSNRDVSSDTKITISMGIISTKPANEFQEESEIEPSEEEKLREINKIIERQKEIALFTEFLRNKFFSS